MPEPQTAGDEFRVRDRSEGKSLLWEWSMTTSIRVTYESILGLERVKEKKAMEVDTSCVQHASIHTTKEVKHQLSGEQLLPPDWLTTSATL